MSSTYFVPESSSSGRQLYVQVWCNLFICRLLLLLHVNKLYHTCTYNCLHEDEHLGVKYVEDTIKFNKYYVNNGTFCWLMLYDYIAMHGASNVK